ncbi:hypothetical protein niasHT_030048 [Heterodera trifolii]|uniref:EF-hand domain-containing protein n=1 Tax=Heterodera trifolii TaxID=157864 RepID=A0ABD2JQV6_9BILA
MKIRIFRLLNKVGIGTSFYKLTLNLLSIIHVVAKNSQQTLVLSMASQRYVLASELIDRHSVRTVLNLQHIWLGPTTTDEQNKALHVDHHKLTETQQYQSGKEIDQKHDHEQFLGKDEARQYEELTPDKSKERLAKLVPKMDLNSDGQVDELELREHINFMQKRYVVADYNSDGKMDRTEYGCFMHPEDCSGTLWFRWSDGKKMPFAVHQRAVPTNSSKWVLVNQTESCW